LRMTASTLRVLTYHRVGEDGPVTPGEGSALINSTASVFDRHMRHLARHYRVVTPAEVMDAEAGGRPLPRRAVLITFDDAYRDFLDVAWPILKRHGLTATLFVPTAYPGQPERRFWWDRLQAAFAATTHTTLAETPVGPLSLAGSRTRRLSLRRLQLALRLIPDDEEATAWIENICRALGPEPSAGGQVLGWDELRALAAEGVTLGAHTRTHPALPRLTLDQARSEICGSRDDLQRETGTVPTVFSYPFGMHDDRVVGLVGQAGFRLAVTCIRGHNVFPFSGPLRLRRTNITQRTSALLFRARLVGAASWADAWQHRHRAAYRAANAVAVRK
jgi:peptidoglycan/xylan/chitin deacetylase (PgdA/CDA1 family)